MADEQPPPAADDTVRLSLRLPTPVHRYMKERAHINGISINQQIVNLCTGAAEAYAEERQHSIGGAA